MSPRPDSARAALRRLVEAPQLAAEYFVAHPYAPLLAQVVVTRRCNLKCAYCTEYDRVSQPVPTERLIATFDRLAALHTRAVTLTGGEPTLHPDLPALVAALSQRIAKTSMVTNGYKLTPSLVRELGAAGLGRLQISLDGVEPNEVTAKVLRCTERALDVLAEHATFAVHVNAVLGSIPFDETREVVRAARRRGFETTVQWLHDDRGRAMNPHRVTHAQIDELISECALPPHHSRRVIRAGLEPERAWKCRAGARYLYIDEFSTARWCAHQRDAWSLPVDELTPAVLQRNFHTPKPCEEGCTLGCVRDASRYDRWRSQ